MRDQNTHTKLFDSIAAVYNIFFTYQVRYYRNIVNTFEDIFYFPDGNKVLDIGCGTGALLYCLDTQGWSGTGVDAAQNMLKQAQQSLQKRQTTIDLFKADITKGLPFKDGQFDLVISSYVLHGLRYSDRVKVYTEAQRLSKNMVIFIDYNQKRKILTDIVEWAEGGDYFNFIKRPVSEINTFFSNVQVYNVSAQGALYLCSDDKTLR